MESQESRGRGRLRVETLSPGPPGAATSTGKIHFTSCSLIGFSNKRLLVHIFWFTISQKKIFENSLLFRVFRRILF
jgi:hypothetical protein